MTINCFELVGAVLDNTVERIAKAHGADRTEVLSEMKSHLESMSKAYFSGAQPLIAYGDPLLRAGYLFQHAAVNSHLCAEALMAAFEKSDVLAEKLDEGRLSVCAFGGGPGTELIGVASLLGTLDQLDEDSEQIEVEFRLVDRVNEWSESFSVLKRKINEALSAKYGKKKNWPFIIETSFLTFNITKTQNYNNYMDIFESDIFIMNYMISEVVDSATELEAVINKIASKSKKDAVFLVVDRDEGKVQKRAEDLLKKAGLKVTKPHYTNDQLDSDQWKQRHYLKDYIDFMDRRPRRKWNAFWQIGIKG